MAFFCVLGSIPYALIHAFKTFCTVLVLDEQGTGQLNFFTNNFDCGAGA